MSTTKTERIAQAREHYKTRAERREAQVWFEPHGVPVLHGIVAPPKGAIGATPVHLPRAAWMVAA